MNQRQLTLTPIGYIQTPFVSRYDAPHQPRGHDAGTEKVVAEGVITLNPGENFEQALEDLAGMEKIWILYWFDRNENWKPKVLPPRGAREKRGVFATRAPHRPNPIGLSLVDLLEVRGRTVRVGNVDLLDGTPVLDIKPYLPYLEAHPDARAGWIDEADAMHADPTFQVEWSASAMEDRRVLEEYGVRLTEHVERILSRDPSPHPYRRIERDGVRSIIAVRAWRVYFTIDGSRVTIERIGSGYGDEQIERATDEELNDAPAQRALFARRE
jgi:tRNA-Thr(GGU) m(6)t(6)A37 methyltransferase TsaA